MKKLVLLLALLVASSAVLAEGEDKIGFTIGSDFFSKYVWRGQLLNDDFVFQPSIGASYKGFTASIWGNVDTTNYHGDSGEFTEYDLTFDYSGKFSEDSKVGYSVGLIHYHFPSLSYSDTTELYWGFNFDVPLSPTIKVYHGLGNENGIYANFGLSHTFEKVLKFSDTITGDLALGASIGWGNGTYNKDYWGVDESRLNDLAFTVGIPIDLGNGWAVKPSFNYVVLVDGKIRDTDAYGKSSDYFFTGISISKSF
ncbi:MAG: hypothetical protein WC496_03575 [Phycisphaerae bacterium]|jgi:hypothetical protein